MTTYACPERAWNASAGRADAPDEELVVAVRGGHNDAFGYLFARYQQRVAAYVSRMVGSREHAEEIAQEAFISALRRMRETQQTIAFKPWIYGIARNAAIDHLRARSRRGAEVDLHAVEVTLDSGRSSSTAAGPEAALESKQTMQDLQGAFGGLTDAHHQILILRELEGLSYDEIGERLGMSRSQVESTLFRARRRLEEEYDELVSGERCERVRASITRSATRTLGVRDAARLQRHVSHCQHCRREAQQAQLVPAAA